MCTTRKYRGDGSEPVLLWHGGDVQELCWKGDKAESEGHFKEERSNCCLHNSPKTVSLSASPHPFHQPRVQPSLFHQYRKYISTASRNPTGPRTEAQNSVETTGASPAFTQSGDVTSHKSSHGTASSSSQSRAQRVPAKLELWAVGDGWVGQAQPGMGCADACASDV